MLELDRRRGRGARTQAVHVVLALALMACAPGFRTVNEEPRRDAYALGRERLFRMRGVSAYDALQSIPSYVALMRRQPAPRVALILDDARVYDVGILKAIQAVDLSEIRINRPGESSGQTWEVELVVVTQVRVGAYP
jgi:hypothetical protein